MNRCHNNCKEECTLAGGLNKQLISAKEEIQRLKIQIVKAEEDLDVNTKIFKEIADFSDLKTVAQGLGAQFLSVTESDYLTFFMKTKKKSYKITETNIERIKSRPMAIKDNMKTFFGMDFITCVDVDDFDFLKERDLKTKDMIVVPLFNSRNEKIGMVIGESLHKGHYKSRILDHCTIFSKIASMVIESSMTFEKLKEIAYVDPMIDGAFNRVYLDKIFKDIIVKEGRAPHPFIMVVLDIDKFKTVNDTYGHSIGDIAIKKVGSIILENIRDDDYLIRYGGDEFIIIYNQTNEINLIEQRLNNIREKIMATLLPSGKGENFYVTCSFGMVPSTLFDLVTFDEMFKVADSALYYSKNNGRNRVTVCRNKEQRARLLDAHLSTEKVKG